MDEVLLDARLALRLFVALVLAGALGWEREARRRPAGLRTHMLVGMTSALLVILAEAFILRFGDSGAVVRFDPTRVIEAMVTGVSFLGAGTIFFTKDKERVVGLTTAASILATAAIGLAAGLERYALAVLATALLLIVLAGLRHIEQRWIKKDGDIDASPEGAPVPRGESD